MSWLQVYELSVPHYEIKNGKYVFALQLQRYHGDNNSSSNHQDDRYGGCNAFVTAFQSYSQFRNLWKELLRATKPSSASTAHSTLVSDGKAAFACRNRHTRQRMRSMLPADPSSSSLRGTTASRSSSMLPSLSSTASAPVPTAVTLAPGACPCSNSCCPFTRLYLMLKCYPFPPKMVLKRNSSTILEARRHALEQFVVDVREFFIGFPRSFLHSVDSNEHCRVLNLFATFIGFSEELRSMAINRSPLLVAAWKADMLLNRDQRPVPRVSSSYNSEHSNLHGPERSMTSRSCGAHEDDEQDYDGDDDDDDNDTLEHLPEYRIPTVYIPSLRTVPEDSTAIHDEYHELAIRGRDHIVAEDEAASTDTEDDDISRKYRGSSVYILGTTQAPRRTQPSLPKLQIRSAKVKTLGSFLVDFRDHLLSQFGDILNEPVAIAELDDARQWELGLCLACQIGQVYAAQSILARGTDPNAVVSDGTTPLHVACRSGHNKVANCLLENGADVNTMDKLGMTPLLLAINHGEISLVRMLLDAGADVNLSNVRKVSATHVAVASQSLDILKLLLEYDAFVNTANMINKKTPLHIAAETGNYLICELLLNNGANVYQRNDNGHDAYALAVVHGHVNIAELCRAFQCLPEPFRATRTTASCGARWSANPRDHAAAPVYFADDDDDNSIIDRSMRKRSPSSS
ncbi:50s ribosomal protein l11, partial [Globisporangium splendens]